MTTQKAYATQFKKLADLEAHVGKELGISKWVDITQEKINTFATLTEDEQWIHIDSEQSKLYSPYKDTVAHGFMVLSFASRFAYDTYSFGDVVMGVNYGLNRVRFPNATLVGSRLRGRVSLLEYKTIPNGARYIMQITFELEGQEKPACVAEFIGQAYTNE